MAKIKEGIWEAGEEMAEGGRFGVGYCWGYFWANVTDQYQT